MNQAESYESIGDFPMTYTGQIYDLECHADPVRRPEQWAEAVKAAVCRGMGGGIEPWQLTSWNRAQHLAMARQVAMYLLRTKARLSFPKVAAAMHRSNHTTAMAACRKVAKRMEAEPGFGRLVTGLLRSL